MVSPTHAALEILSKAPAAAKPRASCRSPPPWAHTGSLPPLAPFVSRTSPRAAPSSLDARCVPRLTASPMSWASPSAHAIPPARVPAPPLAPRDPAAISNHANASVYKADSRPSQPRSTHTQPVVCSANCPRSRSPPYPPTPAARSRLLPSSTSFFVQTPAARLSSPMKVNPYASGGALSESVPSKPTLVESKPIMKPFNLRVLTTRQIQDMARAAQTAHNNQVQARMVAESILNRVRRRTQRRRFPRFGGIMGASHPAHSPLRKLAFDESDASDDSGSSDSGSAFGDWSSEDGSDEESLEEWERQLGDVSWFVDNGYD